MRHVRVQVACSCKISCFRFSLIYNDLVKPQSRMTPNIYGVKVKFIKQKRSNMVRLKFLIDAVASKKYDFELSLKNGRCVNCDKI